MGGDGGLDRIVDVACRAARSAARVCRRVLDEAPAEPEAMAKLGKEPVTLADYGSQAVILGHVRDAFPGHAVIAEEGADHLRGEATEAYRKRIAGLVGTAIGRPVTFDEVCERIDHAGGDEPYTWTIDPIDGTKGFLRRDQYAVAIGVLHHGRPVAGVLACPNSPWDVSSPSAGTPGVLYVAARGRGARREPLDGGAAERIRVSAVDAPAGVRVLGSVESAHGDPRVVRAVIEDLGLGGGIVRVDSQVKYGVVAAGAAEVYLRPVSRPDYRERVWDHAAGALVTEEAGGRVTDLDGRPLDFTRGSRLGANRGVLATNGRVHDRVIESLARLAGV